MKHHEARVGDIVKEIAKGDDAPEMRVWAYDGGGNLHCEWKGPDGREEKTFDPCEVEIVSKRDISDAAGTE